MTQDKASELVELAAVVRSHGLRGELVLKPFNRESELLHELAQVQLKLRDGSLQSHAVEGARPHGEWLLFTLRDVRSREQADALRGSLVCVPRSELPALDEGEHYLIDLVGLAVQDAQGQAVGRVTQVLEYPTVQCLVVEGEQGVREVPILDRYVLQIDAQAQLVRVDHLDELELVAPKAER